MRKKSFLAFFASIFLYPGSLDARNYNVSFKDTPPKAVISALKKETGYNFVYKQKSIDSKAPKKITGSYTDMPLETLLKSIISDKMGLDYEIVNGKTVVISVPEKKGVVFRKTIRGIVVDNNGEPLPGATIMVKGTTNGVPTDIEGDFTINVEETDPVLAVNYVGMHTVYIRLTNDNTSRPLRIEMCPNESLLEEVVVTGYQNIKRENATGSYQTITATDLDKRSTSDLASRLEGAVPGLVMDPKSGSANEDAFTIRGVGTFRAKSSPLVVVDGLPIEGGMSTVNPYEIANITILKDAAASSIYGARASNGVIVITTKQATSQKLTVDFNADVNISERQDYSNFEWANAAELIELEKYNFNAMKNEEGQPGLESLFSNYDNGYLKSISKVSRLLIRNYRGELSDSELEETLAKWSRNDYRKEYQDVHDRTRVSQLYNLSLRNQGKYLSSSLNVNYTNDNHGVVGESSNSLTFKYRGDIKASKWLNLTFGINLLNSRSKSHVLGEYGDMNSFSAYDTMYGEDRLPRRMEAGIPLENAALNDPSYGMRDASFNLIDEMKWNYSKNRYTNTRSYINARINILEGWTATGMFQYEDIFSTSGTLHEKDSYYIRNLYNLYTDYDGNHIFPGDGGSFTSSTSEGKYYTFRAQTDYNHTFGKHFIGALAGMEYRQTETHYENNTLLGYDPQTETNTNLAVDWATMKDMWGSALGDEFQPSGAPAGFGKTRVLHRYYSLYANANYVYDSRYAISGSYRIDKTDLFGVDPKFRGRPLWSFGASWNAHNESFLSGIEWLNALKLRVSYGLTGNIDPSSSSYLTAKIRVSSISHNRYGMIETPPNDQLRWEKTATWNGGVDFAFLGHRLNGSLDLYRKKGSDLLTLTDLDFTTGYSSLTINSGDMLNTGVELQLDGVILRQRSRKDIGINLGFNIAFNKNKVTKITHFVNDGFSNMLESTMHKGYPLNSLFSYDYAGLREIDGVQHIAWRDHDGEEHTSSITSGADFTKEDIVYSGSSTPVISGAFLPMITWNGFSLTATLNYYGGHYMRVGNDEWTTEFGGEGGYDNNYGNGAVSRHALEYWRGNKDYPANGYMRNYTQYMDYPANCYRNTNVVHADYLKVRNVTLSYNFNQSICRKIKISDLRLRFQINNLATWARNGRSLDPEAVFNGCHGYKTPRSYTCSLYFSL